MRTVGIAVGLAAVATAFGAAVTISLRALLVAVTLAGAAAIAWYGSSVRPREALLAAALLAAGGAVGGLGLWFGASAGAGVAFEARAPHLVGLPVARARRLLLRPGRVPVRVRTVPWATRYPGRVVKVIGLAFDGTYTSDSHLTLVIGPQRRAATRQRSAT